jgi:hypothetical protein
MKLGQIMMNNKLDSPEAYAAFCRKHPKLKMPHYTTVLQNMAELGIKALDRVIASDRAYRRIINENAPKHKPRWEQRPAYGILGTKSNPEFWKGKTTNEPQNPQE